MLPPWLIELCSLLLRFQGIECYQRNLLRNRTERVRTALCPVVVLNRQILAFCNVNLNKTHAILASFRIT